MRTANINSLNNGRVYNQIVCFGQKVSQNTRTSTRTREYVYVYTKEHRGVNPEHVTPITTVLMYYYVYRADLDIR